MSGVLGLIVIEKDNSASKRSRVLVSNYLSLFDHIALHLATGTFTVCIMKLIVVYFTKLFVMILAN